MPRLIQEGQHHQMLLKIHGSQQSSPARCCWHWEKILFSYCFWIFSVSGSSCIEITDETHPADISLDRSCSVIDCNAMALVAQVDSQCLTVQHNSHYSDLVEGHTSILFYYYLSLAEMLLPLIIDFNQSKSCVFNRFMKERKISDAVVSHLSFYGIIQSFFLERPSIFKMYLFAHPWNLFTLFNLKPYTLSC